MITTDARIPHTIRIRLSILHYLSFLLSSGLTNSLVVDYVSVEVNLKLLNAIGCVKVAETAEHLVTCGFSIGCGDVALKDIKISNEKADGVSIHSNYLSF